MLHIRPGESNCSVQANSLSVFPLSALYRYRYLDPEYNLNLKKLYFYWICPDTNAFEWFTDLLQEMEAQMAEAGKSDFFKCNIYLTRGWDDKQVRRSQ